MDGKERKEIGRKKSISKNRRKEFNELKYLSNWKETSKVVKSEMENAIQNVIRGLQKVRKAKRVKAKAKENFKVIVKSTVRESWRKNPKKGVKRSGNMKFKKLEGKRNQINYLLHKGSARI